METDLRPQYRRIACTGCGAVQAVVFYGSDSGWEGMVRRWVCPPCSQQRQQAAREARLQPLVEQYVRQLKSLDPARIEAAIKALEDQANRYQAMPGQAEKAEAILRAIGLFRMGAPTN